jgi:hypothetical protein
MDHTIIEAFLIVTIGGLGNRAPWWVGWIFGISQSSACCSAAVCHRFPYLAVVIILTSPTVFLNLSGRKEPRVPATRSITILLAQPPALPGAA